MWNDKFLPDVCRKGLGKNLVNLLRISSFVLEGQRFKLIHLVCDSQRFSCINVQDFLLFSFWKSFSVLLTGALGKLSQY